MKIGLGKNGGCKDITVMPGGGMIGTRIDKKAGRSLPVQKNVRYGADSPLFMIFPPPNML